ncbi:hypothetical protein AVP_75 [Aerococcus phage vB_AviM_AVP]|nr:hypothetical protein AVP_75 [Aerococcus phage vB_AviM_AVP]
MLKHTNKRNFTTATKYGKVTFDKDGISKDLTQEQQKELAEAIGVYEYESDTKSTAKKSEPKKEETKADDKEEAPKKTTTRKTTTRKTTAKKDTEDK